MTRLGTGIVESVVYHYGTSELPARLSDPFWFQALGSVMGMDWHSSGITTAVMGALKRGLNPRAEELGLYIGGGRGRHSRNTPDELRAIAERRGLDGDALVGTSRLTARVDNNAIADGFQIYLHTFVLSATGEWAAVLATAYERELRDFASLLLVENLGPRTLQSLALVAEVVHGAPARFSDPARFSFAHGRKDGHPFPVPLKAYDESIAVLRRALDAARVGDPEKLAGMRRLDGFVGSVERRCEPKADFGAMVAHQRQISSALGGRTIFATGHARRPAPHQLPLSDDEAVARWSSRSAVIGSTRVARRAVR